MGFGHWIKHVGKDIRHGAHRVTRRIEHGLHKVDGWYHKHRGTFDKIRHSVGHVIDKGDDIARDIAEINPAVGRKAIGLADKIRHGADTINKKIDEHEQKADEREDQFRKHAKKLKDVTNKLTGHEHLASEGGTPTGLSYQKKALHPPNSARVKKPRETVPGSQARPAVSVRRKRTAPIGADSNTWGPPTKKTQRDNNKQTVGGPGTLPPSEHGKTMTSEPMN